MQHFRVLLGLGLVSLAALSYAQAGFAGKRQYPQARSLSGLPGGGAAVLPNGRPAIQGALTLSTPIGYTLDGESALLIGGTTSASGSLAWFDGDVATNGSNGTAAVIFGMRFSDATFGVSLVQTSRLPEDRVVNLQVSPNRQSGRLGFSVGVQDLLDNTVTTPDYHESAQSLFVATTYEAGDGVYLTAGAGTRRFSKGFASVSAPLVRGTRAMVENDGFGWNYGLAVRLFDIPQSGRPAQASMFIGSCQGRYTTWSLSLRF
jgi:hypothetical protein